MTKREQATLKLAVAILKNSSKASAKPSMQSEAVQLALRVLLGHASKDDLITYWKVAGGESGHHRTFRLRKLIDMIESSVARSMAGPSR